MLQGKKIILGITGSIAAYKSILLLRLLKKAGADVKVVMTPSAREFASPLVLSTLSGSRVVIELTDGNSWENHVALGRWADLLLIAPLSCNSLSKMVIGQCDNLLLAVYLSANCPVMIAPAMDTDMWVHPATKNNIHQLAQRGHLVLPVEKGELASGLTGEGRMSEPESIYKSVLEFFISRENFKGKTVLITAGPTYEHIDPVRFIGNHSSGKMGIAIAEAFAGQGADVTLILGPSSEKVPALVKQVFRIQSAEELRKQCVKHISRKDIIVMAAAVADFKPVKTSLRKIKKESAELMIQLEPTADVLQELGKVKKKNQLLVGFALETDQEEANALKKLNSKGADLIILNSLQEEGAGFGTDTNKITIFEKGGKKTSFPLKTKAAVAADIVAYIQKKLHG
jgi:phosphopantothenoylcysteine decarboxylase/phosphopantothenate--cysteine ligase